MQLSTLLISRLPLKHFHPNTPTAVMRTPMIVATSPLTLTPLSLLFRSIAACCGSIGSPFVTETSWESAKTPDTVISYNHIVLLRWYKAYTRSECGGKPFVWDSELLLYGEGSSGKDYT